jgi:hypothetical protein
VVGVRFGLEPGPERRGVPVRTTLVAAATAVALVTAVVVFSGSVRHLLDTPQLYGSAWDAQIDLSNANTPAGFNPSNASQFAELVRIERQIAATADQSGSVAASALLDVGEIHSGEVAIPAVGYTPRVGNVGPTIAAGRAPRSANEIALGANSMTQLHTHIGGTIQVREHESGPARPLQVVGRAVLPGLAPYPGSDKADLGIGAVLTGAGWKEFSPDYQKTIYIFQWAPHRNESTLTAAFSKSLPSQLPLGVTPANEPAGVLSLERLRSTPTLLAALVALLLAAAVANALTLAVRRRRRDLAILRTLGFTTGQVVRTVLWQATTVGSVAVVVGIPFGILLGRWTWNLLASNLGAVPVPVVELLPIVFVGCGVLMLANFVGVVPGLRAARAPARALRVE